MHLGFTGSSNTITGEQKEALLKELSRLLDKGVHTFHHGDCVVADQYAHYAAKMLGYVIHIHPPINPYARAFCVGANVMHECKEYLDRNHDIVDSSDLLIAVSESTVEVLRSGTWSTIRYAKKLRKPIKIIFPDGKVELVTYKTFD